MKVDTLHLMIAIHYHRESFTQWPTLHDPVDARHARDLSDAGLLHELPRGGYTYSDGLEVWINAILETPLPSLQWVMPARD